jgi:hypothetical protein
MLLVESDKLLSYHHYSHIAAFPLCLSYLLLLSLFPPLKLSIKLLSSSSYVTDKVGTESENDISLTECNSGTNQKKKAHFELTF